MVGEFVLLLGLISLGVLTIAYGCILLHFRKVPQSVRDRDLPRVTVLKPMRGVDPGLEKNLEAVILQDHPNFEIIFGSEDPFDPSLDVARRLAERYRRKNIKVVGGGAPREGVNPKVRILRRMLEFASSEWVLISDSNVRPEPDYLRTMQAVQLTERADLVHTVLSGCSGESSGARLEELQLNGWVAASICFAQLFGHPCVIGKSMLMRRSFLVDEGALVRMQNILAEDYTMGAELHRANKRVALAPYRLPVVTGGAPFGAFLNRHIRWGQMRRRIAPLSFFCELSANPTPFLVLSLFLLDGEARLWPLAAQIVKWSFDIMTYVWLSQFPTLKTASLIPLKDLLVPIMWGVSAVKRTVKWRGHVMWVGPGSRLEPLPQATEPELNQAQI